VVGTVTLDGQGGANAVWIFQVGSSLTVNSDAQVPPSNGAKAEKLGGLFEDDPQTMDPVLEAVAKAIAQDSVCRVRIAGGAASALRLRNEWSGTSS
jgi:hypothetical protein